MKRHSAHSNNNFRITLLMVLFFVFFAIILIRLFYLQIIRHDYYSASAENRHTEKQIIKSERGEIFVLDSSQNLQPIATNQKTYLLYGIPSMIENATATIAQIEKVIPFDDEERWQIYLKLTKPNDPYEPIRKNLTQKQKRALERLEIENIGFEENLKRFYPQNNLYSDVLGFLGFSNDERIGQYGIEEYFEKNLAGESKTIKIEKDPKGRLISFGKNDLLSQQKGESVLLTIDPTVQFKSCEILKKWQEAMLAEDGTLIIMEPYTGKIISMCDVPSFDLNNYSQVANANIYFNKAVTESYEPGSVFKPLTMAMAIELGKVSPDTKYFDEGFMQLGTDTIRNADSKTYGEVDMIQVLEDSINTGVATIALEKIGKNNFKKYVEGFGFGEKTNINLPAESSGTISSLNSKSDIYTATASYGQGIMTTPLQITSAFSVIANGGILMKPQIVEKLISEKGKEENFESQQVRRVISSKTANVLKAMLVSVVKNGHGARAGVNHYYVAGKTGTANIADPRGGYSEQTIHTFVGFAPVEIPKFVIFLKLSRPKNVRFSSDSAAPAFAEIAEFLLQYYQVPPDY